MTDILKNFTTKHKLPLYTFADCMALSGGYWILSSGYFLLESKFYFVKETKCLLIKVHGLEVLELSVNIPNFKVS